MKNEIHISLRLKRVTSPVMPGITFPIDNNLNDYIATILKNMFLLSMKPIIIVTDERSKVIFKINMPIGRRKSCLHWIDNQLTILDQ